MQRTASITMNQFIVMWRHTLSAATKLSLAILCGLLLTSGALAQEEQRPEPPPTPEESSAAAAPTPQAPNPNELTTPAPLANQVVDGDITFTSPGQFTYLRDIHLSDNFGGLRFHGTNGLTTSPAGAAIQFFGNNATPYPGQLYLDSGAHNEASLIFRTAPTGGTITERMRVRADGNVLVGTATPSAKLTVLGNAGGNAIAGLTAVGSGATGVYGASPNGYGVRGFSNTDAGVYGQSGSNFGVLGRSESSVGMYGYSQSGTGVIGESSSGNAASFYGNVAVNGRLTKSSGSFKIDHPLDPENKYLSHSFVESPDMMNIYNGNITLDARGRAVVTMPEWFEALNREFRYQLTAVGAPGPNLYVAEKIKGNRFRIAGGKRGMEVSWMVTGVRQDAYARQNRIAVEEDKPAAERGTYLNPEAFGQPAEKRVGHARQPSTATPPPAAETSKEIPAVKRTATAQQ